MVDLMRCLAIERRVRATLIVPVSEKRYLLVERVRVKWQENNTRAFVLETQYESFNERDTAVSRTRALMLSAAQARAYTMA